MICKFGPLISDARGKIGGVVFSRGRSGSFARSVRVPVYNQTNTRSRWAAAMAICWSWWVNTVTPAQRADWNTLGDNTTFVNALGSNYHPSGWNLFLRTNSLSNYWHLLYAGIAPANAVQTHWTVTYSWDEADQYIKGTCPADPPVDSAYIFNVSPAFQKTVFHTRGPFVYGNAVNVAQIKVTGRVTPNGMYSTGDRVFIRDRLRAETGELSAPYYTLFDCEV